MRYKLNILAALVFIAGSLSAQENTNTNKFRQLYQELPTPNAYRTASGAPGPWYYQQQADYKMNIELDDAKQIIRGQETITYTNNSKDQLTYLWLQLDQNVRAKDSETKLVSTQTLGKKSSFRGMDRMMSDFDGGFKVEEVKDASGKDLTYTINKTMMRIDLPKTLSPGGKISFKIKWWYNVNNRMEIGGRSGYEYFEEDDNYLYTIAQFFPRMCVYNEVEGWQNKQFLGRGEFTLPFGNYEVSLTVPEDHMVAATGELQNASSVLTTEQRSRLSKAKTADKPVMIVTPDEALDAEKEKKTGTKTWNFKATNVRDFGFASSRKFIWDAIGVKLGSRTVMCMSMYPKEGNPLWEQYSTEVVAHTIRTYSKYTFDYPYPVAWSVHANHIGMEYPMICFNGGRPEKDGTYSEGTKYGMIGVITHEVGHNFFPMIVNSDERQWTWMDEGLNTFVQYLTQSEWSSHYPHRRGPAAKIVPYMKGDKSRISPIMTNSESIWQFGNNAYGKPATALNILRETVMGRELFDYAFKEYCTRWMFKHPSPADFFRTMEDASGMDLDWFWRGWFYTTDHVDISLEEVKWYQINTMNPSVEKKWSKEQDESKRKFIGQIRNDSTINFMIDQKPELKDFYDTDFRYTVNEVDEAEYKKKMERLSDKQKALLNSNMNFYQLRFKNLGGLVMPVILEITFTDNSKEVIRIPAEIWRQNNEEVSKVLFFEKEVKGIEIDPFLETADVDTDNNYWPRVIRATRFDVYKSGNYKRQNPMQRAGEGKKE
ncbi:MAG: aminopeptidase [Crocinitomicaceae bacterium]|nr:aminopeptidase [Crocinitomicaceae bacterium]|tara:strand:+ start:18071 stop:20377 length:2307 start_codon:yes stop_codon:yes gene_type:complete